MTKHVAISLDSVFDWCRKNNAGIKEACDKYFGFLLGLIEQQVKSLTPIFTIYLLPDSDHHNLEFYERMSDFFNELSQNSVISQNNIKVSIFGKWYKLPGKAVESLKKTMEETKDYDGFFINFCVNYDGQEEIADACRLIAKQVQLGRIDPEMISKDAIKENLYSSYFMPPDILFIYGDRKLSGLLLWDSVGAKVVFADKSFMEFDEKDFERLL